MQWLQKLWAHSYTDWDTPLSWIEPLWNLLHYSFLNNGNWVHLKTELKLNFVTDSFASAPVTCGLNEIKPSFCKWGMIERILRLNFIAADGFACNLAASHFTLLNPCQILIWGSVLYFFGPPFTCLSMDKKTAFPDCTRYYWPTQHSWWAGRKNYDFALGRWIDFILGSP